VSVNLMDPLRYRGAIERLTLEGNANLSGVGNALANVIVGNAGNNYLNGLGGADTMTGLKGNDTYVVDNRNDVVNEAAPGSGGSDWVRSTVSVNLMDPLRYRGAIERLTLEGNANLSGVGNALANVIVGNAGNNYLNGLGGADILIGGAGSDRFHFSAELGGGNVDNIRDFSAADDSILLDAKIFSSLTRGQLASSAFKDTRVGAVDADDRLIYDSLTGALSFDQDGAAAGFMAVSFAMLENRESISSLDFFVV
jgi:Ca2+-binding RTX toxin-like protein